MHKCVWFQKTVPCDLCKEVLMVVEQILKDNATEVSLKYLYVEISWLRKTSSFNYSPFICNSDVDGVISMIAV